MTSVRMSPLGIGCNAFYPHSEEEQAFAFSLMKNCPNVKKETCRCNVVPHLQPL